MTALRNEFSQSLSQIQASLVSQGALDTALRNEFSQSLSQIQASLVSQGALDTALGSRIDSDSAIMTALRNELSQSLSQIQASLVSQGALDTALGSRIDSDSAIMTALRNEFSQSFSQIHASIVAVDSRVDTVSAGLTTHTASISALNTTISGITTTLTDYSNSLSQLHSVLYDMSASALNWYYTVSALNDVAFGGVEIFFSGILGDVAGQTYLLKLFLNADQPSGESLYATTQRTDDYSGTAAGTFFQAPVLLVASAGVAAFCHVRILPAMVSGASRMYTILSHGGAYGGTQFTTKIERNLAAFLNGLSLYSQNTTSGSGTFALNTRIIVRKIKT
jgi:hypothetical protein